MTVPFRYLKLGFAELHVTNLNKSVDFYTEIVGLEYVEGSETSAYLRCSQDHHNVILVENSKHGLRRVGFQLETEKDVDLAFEHFSKLNYQPTYVSDEELSKSKFKKSIRVTEKSTGLELELFATPMYMSTPYKPTHTLIERIGHVVISALNGEDAKNTFVNDFGFKISDFIEDSIYFMRCHPNPYHHTFGVGPSTENRFHHLNFMVSNIDDIGKALYRIKKNDIKVVFGPGRHPPSNSVFFYFLDPDGMTVEYSFGMEEFPELGAREARHMEPVLSSIDVWGAVPEPEFGKSGPILSGDSDEL